MQVTVYSPRRKPLTTEVAAGETFGALRARLGAELGAAPERGLLLHHGEQVRDDEPAGSRLHSAAEVLFYLEVVDPPKRTAERRGGLFGMPVGRGAGRGMPGNSAAASLASSLMQRLQQAQQPGAGGGGRAPAAAAARPPPTQQQEQAQMAQELVQQLTEMGFSKARAMAALRSSSFDLIDALQWLEEHADDPEDSFSAAAPSPVPSAGAALTGAAAAAAPAAAAQPSPLVVNKARLFEPVLRAIALVACGNTRPQQALDEVRLPAMENDGWTGFHAAVRRIWAGERSAAALKAGLDANTTYFVDKVLEQIALGTDTLASQADQDTWYAMPKDPDFDPVLTQLSPMLQRMAKYAVESTREALGQGGMVDEGEEKELTEFIAKMEAAQYQLKTGWDMVCAGVREVGDLLECVPPLANGKPDDKSCRLLRSLVTKIIEVEAQ